MAARLYLIAGKATDSVTDGFLPAARRLGLDVTILTDRGADHATAAAEVMECDVTDFRAIVSAVARHHPAAAIFSNSDHLQTPAALAAAYFGLAAKDWRATLRTKNKALMRARLAELDIDRVRSAVLPPGGEPADPAGLAERAAVPYPLVVKPGEGVASEDVFLVAGPDELAARCREIRLRRPGAALLIEEYLPGTLHTLETLGDGRAITVLGSFTTTLSEPPHFVEERLDWAPRPEPEITAQVLGQLTALGVGLGACHTEFVHAAGRTRLIEVNYRIIGDHCDFLLADLLGVPVFEYVLRAHLGRPVAGDLRERLDRADPPAGPHAARHAIVDAVIADRSGVLTAAPGALAERTGDGVDLTYRPVRAVGDTITLANTNRDYLGMIRAIGPDRPRVEAAAARLRARHRWEITP